MLEKNNLVITGLPRSGTSYLCAKINDFDNAVVINEPAEVFKELKGGSLSGLSNIFSQYRKDIIEGRPVYNKIRDGKFIEDTRLEDIRSMHIHHVDNDQFMLGVKNTLVFMAMLSEIAQVKNGPKIIASIRHPYDCIGSWYNVDFPHLKQANPEFLTDYATGFFRRPLANVLGEDNLASRSAKLWLLLAQTLLVMRRRIHIVRYEDMITKPEKTNKSICRYLGLVTDADLSVRESKPVKRRDKLSGKQRTEIASVCNKVAVQFGYRLD